MTSDSASGSRGSLVALATGYLARRSGRPVDDVALFARLLREAGVPVPMAAVLLAARAVDKVRLDRREDFQAALRACMTSSLGETAVFDTVFRVFWSEPTPPTDEASDEESRTEAQRSGTDGEATGSAGDLLGSQGRGHAHTSQRATYSKGGRPRHASLVLSQDREMEEQLRRLARVLGTSRGRRHRSSKSGGLVDMRGSFRDNIRYGGEIVDLRRSRPVPGRPRLVILCDVSSSMLPYTPMFLTFAYSLSRIVRSVETAVFNVETSFVTELFRRHSLPEAMAWLEAKSIVLAGGTLTGHCLHAFNGTLEARGILRSGTTAIILSDGWDVGDPDLLRAEMSRLRAQVGRIVWLDPHAAATGYQPQVSGLQIALPDVDDYLDFSTVDSIRELVTRLSVPAGSRSDRRRHFRHTYSSSTEGQIE